MAKFNFSALRETMNQAIENNTGVDSSEVVTMAEEAANDLVGMLNSASPADFGWAHGAPTVSGLTATIDVYPSNNTRPSLDPYDYPSGAIDLVDILDRGYSASGKVYGEWHGAEIQSRTSFGGTNFLEPTIASFEGSHPYATVTLNRS